MNEVRVRFVAEVTKEREDRVRARAIPERDVVQTFEILSIGIPMEKLHLPSEGENVRLKDRIVELEADLFKLRERMRDTLRMLGAIVYSQPWHEITIDRGVLYGMPPGLSVEQHQNIDGSVTMMVGKEE